MPASKQQQQQQPLQLPPLLILHGTADETLWYGPGQPAANDTMLGAGVCTGWLLAPNVCCTLDQCNGVSVWRCATPLVRMLSVALPDAPCVGTGGIADYWAERRGCQRPAAGSGTNISSGSSGSKGGAAVLEQPYSNTAAAPIWRRLGTKPVTCWAMCRAPGARSNPGGGSKGLVGNGSSSNSSSLAAQPAAAFGVVLCAVGGGDHNAWSFGKAGDTASLVW